MVGSGAGVWVKNAVEIEEENLHFWVLVESELHCVCHTGRCQGLA